MSSNVYANGREISAKKDGNKVLGAMPDVCLSPPSPPAGPLPVPYPNFSQDSDTSSGTRTVVIKGKEVGQKNKSNFKKSKGDEAATRSFGMGVVTHTIQGKTKHVAWSFDVYAEGKNVTRHLDFVTINHINSGNSGGTGPEVSSQIPPPTKEDCEDLKQENQAARQELAATNTTDQDLVGPTGNGEGTTVSSAAFKPAQGGAAKILTAHNNQKAHERCKRRFAAGGKKSLRKKGASSLCDEAEHTHGKPHMQKSGHAEARILDEMFKGRPGRPGQVTFNVNLIKKSGNRSNLPCKSCHAMMCAAKKCGLEIFLCNKSGEPQPLTNNLCPPTSSKRKALRRLLNK
jgi:hypothetical protein